MEIILQIYVHKTIHILRVKVTTMNKTNIVCFHSPY